MREGNSFSNKLKNFIMDKKGLLFTAVIVAAAVIWIFFAVSGTAGQVDESAVNSLQKAIERAAVQCYAIEGFYPPEVSYLKKYGVTIDDKFIVEYNCEIPNNLPIIKVMQKK